MNKRILIFIIVLSIIGFIVASISMMHHFDLLSGNFCKIGQEFDCDIVNKSTYSEIMEIPVALLGMIAYIFFFIAALLKIKNPSDKSLTLFILIGAVVGFLFSLYLTGVEAFILEVWCMLCLISQFVILLTLIFSIYLFRIEKSNKNSL
jgi:uncharacterized membrane protein